jgi:SEC-C motif domain protein
MEIKTCFCGSIWEYENCCEPLHTQKIFANTAEQLMRSRYSAYVKNLSNYLLNTSHPSTRKNYNKIDIETWASQNSWQKLQIIKVKKGLKNDSEGIVEFKAFFLDKDGVAQKHHEKSTFVKEGIIWYYLKGKVY